MSKNTPGPWKINGSNISESVSLYGDTWLHYRSIGTLLYRNQEDAANAALIAAAPELLEVLEDLIANINERDHDLDPHYIEKATKLLNKINGE